MTLIVLSISLASLLIMSIISFYGMHGARKIAIQSGIEIGQKADRNSSELLAEQRKKELVNIAVDRANDINHRLIDLAKNVEIVASEMQRIEAHPQDLLPQEVGGPSPAGAGKIVFYLQYGKDIPLESLKNEIGLAANVRNALIGLIEHNLIIDSIFVSSKHNFTLSADNYLFTSPSNYTPPGLHYDAVASDWYQLAAEKKGLIFTPVRRYVFNNQMGIFCAIPYYSPDGDMSGVACLQAPLSRLGDLVDQVNLHTKGFCFVIDHQGHVILSSDKEAAEQKGELSVDLALDRRNSANVTLAETIHAMINGKKGINEIIIDGKKYYVAYAPIEQTGWSFAAAVDESDVMAPIAKNNERIREVTVQNINALNQHMVSILLATAALVLVLLITVAIAGKKMSDRFVDPIRILSDGVREIASGNLNKQIDIHTEDEIEHLAICFNAMTEGLRESMEKLTKATEEKEQQNQLLRKKNEELTAALHAVETMRISRDNYRAESEIDQMTQLFNKITAERICKEQCQSLAPGQTAALYIIDLDHFKEANDTCGHQHGDHILMEFANQLKLICRKEDCVSRFGGDEFVVMMTGALSHENILQKAQAILQAARSLRVDGSLAKITASIGIATAPSHGTDYQTLFQSADQALYKVKESGRNGLCLFPSEIHR